MLGKRDLLGIRFFAKSVLLQIVDGDIEPLAYLDYVIDRSSADGAVEHA